MFRAAFAAASGGVTECAARACSRLRDELPPEAATAIARDRSASLYGMPARGRPSTVVGGRALSELR